MVKAHADAIRKHRLRDEILGDQGRQPLRQPARPWRRVRPDRGRGRVASAGDRGLPGRRAAARPRQAVGPDRKASLPETVRVELFSIASRSVRSHLSDILRSAGGETRSASCASCSNPACARFRPPQPSCIRSEVRNEAAARRERLIALGASEEIVRGLVRLFELDGVFGIAALAARRKIDELARDPRLYQASAKRSASIGPSSRSPASCRPTNGSGCSPPALRATSSNCGSNSCRASRARIRTRAVDAWIEATAGPDRPVPRARRPRPRRGSGQRIDARPDRQPGANPAREIRAPLSRSAGRIAIAGWRT